MNLLKWEKERKATPVIASFWYLICNGINAGISFFVIPIFSRIMTTEEYGVVAVYQAWLTLFSIFCTLTVWGGVFNVGVTKFQHDKEKYLATSQSIAFLITGFFLMLAVMWNHQIGNLLEIPNILVICLFVEIAMSIPINLWLSLQRYDYQYKKVIIITLITSVLTPIIGIMAVLESDNKIVTRVMSSLIIQVIIGVLIAGRIYIKGKSFYIGEMWRFIFKFSIPLIPHYLSMQILNQTDRIIINRMCGSSYAGIYSTAYSFSMIMTVLTNAINASLTPYIYKCMKKKKFKDINFLGENSVVIIALLTSILLCIVPDIFKIMLPEEYYEAIWIIPSLTGAVFFMYVYPLFSTIEFYFEETKYVSISSAVAAVLNIFLNLIFIPRCGFIAAGYTTLVCYMALSIFHYFAMKYVLKKQNFVGRLYDYKKIVFIAVVFLVICLGIVKLYNFIVCRWICAVGLGSISMIYVWILGKKMKNRIINIK